MPPSITPGRTPSSTGAPAPGESVSAVPTLATLAEGFRMIKEMQEFNTRMMEEQRRQFSQSMEASLQMLSAREALIEREREDLQRQQKLLETPPVPTPNPSTSLPPRPAWPPNCLFPWPLTEHIAAETSILLQRMAPSSSTLSPGANSSLRDCLTPQTSRPASPPREPPFPPGEPEPVVPDPEDPVQSLWMRTHFRLPPEWFWREAYNLSEDEDW